MTSAAKIPFLSTILLSESIPDNFVECAGFVPKISLAPFFLSILTIARFLFCFSVK